jgi:hypothetical protein
MSSKALRTSALGLPDKIDLSGIDAIAVSSFDNAFRFVKAFTGSAGQAVINDNGATVTVALDVTGNGIEDGQIFVLVASLSADDFVL